MKARNIGYWVTTGLLAAAFLAGGLADLSRSSAVMEGMSQLGYPGYFASILGTWKVLGALAIVAPGLPRLKEWAYAGIVFDLSGAFISHLAVGDGADKFMPSLVLLGVALASWALRPESRVLGKLATAPVAQVEAERRDVKLATT